MNPSGTTRTDERLVGDALERRLEDLLQQNAFHLRRVSNQARA